MNEHQIRCFTAAAKYLNFSKAAEEQFMTQTAMSYQIAALEKVLDVRLFERSAQRVSLTEAGISFLPYANSLLSHMEKAKQDVRESSKTEGSSLRLGCFGDVLFPMLPDLLKTFRRLYPDVSVTLHQGYANEIVESLDREDIDLGILTGYGDYVLSLSWLEHIHLFTDTHCAVLPKDHPLADRKILCLEDLSSETLILYVEKDLIVHENLKNDIYDMVLLNDPRSNVVLVEAGYGACICVSHVCPKDNPNLSCIPISDTKMEIYACRRKDRKKNSVEAFLDVLKGIDYSTFCVQEVD